MDEELPASGRAQLSFRVVCYVCEVEDASYVFEPACESHTAVAGAHGQTWQMLVVDDFDDEMRNLPYRVKK